MRARFVTRIIHAYFDADRHVVGYRGVRRPSRVLRWRGQPPTQDRSNADADARRVGKRDGDAYADEHDADTDSHAGVERHRDADAVTDADPNTRIVLGDRFESDWGHDRGREFGLFATNGNVHRDRDRLLG